MLTSIFYTRCILCLRERGTLLCERRVVFVPPPQKYSFSMGDSGTFLCRFVTSGTSANEDGGSVWEDGKLVWPATSLQKRASKTRITPQVATCFLLVCLFVALVRIFAIRQHIQQRCV